jgi:hypothetical protein
LTSSATCFFNALAMAAISASADNSGPYRGQQRLCTHFWPIATMIALLISPRTLKPTFWMAQGPRDDCGARCRSRSVPGLPQRVHPALATMETTMAMPKNCVFCTTANRLIDFISDNDDGRMALMKFAPEYRAALIILSVDDAWQRYENSFKQEPAEITRDRFHEMLNILPPVA